jgi:hypothetical protein
VAGGLFDRFAPVIARLPPGRLTAAELLTDAFLMERDGELSMYYVPFERVNRDARVVLIGITPGFTQMRVAYETARDGLVGGLPHPEILRRVDMEASFAGSMRTNLNRMLDDLGVPALLGIDSAEQLFGDQARLLHSTSALRNPVFVRGANYTGASPAIATTPLLRRVIIETLAPELAGVPSAVLVPLGGAAERALQLLVSEGLVERERCCLGFPHPSGANGHRARLFGEHRDELSLALQAWFDASPVSSVAHRVTPASDAWTRAAAALASALTREERETLADRLRRLSDELAIQE